MRVYAIVLLLLFYSSLFSHYILQYPTHTSLLFSSCIAPPSTHWFLFILLSLPHTHIQTFLSVSSSFLLASSFTASGISLHFILNFIFQLPWLSMDTTEHTVQTKKLTERKRVRASASKASNFTKNANGCRVLSFLHPATSVRSTIRSLCFVSVHCETLSSWTNA